MLNSILGIASPLPAASVIASKPTSAQPTIAQQAPQAKQEAKQPQGPAQPTDMPFNPLAAASSHIQLPMQIQNSVISNRVGDASFAQAAGSTSPNPPTPLPNLTTHLDPASAQAIRSNASSPGNVTPQARPNGQVSHPLHLAPHSQTGPGHLAPAGPVHPMVDALTSAAQHQIPNGTIRAPNEANEMGKRMFVQDMLHLLHVSSCLGVG